MDRDCKRNCKEEDEKELKLNFISLLELVGREVTAGANLNLGERKNNPKRKEEEEGEKRHDGSLPFKSVFSLFCGLSEKEFSQIFPRQPTKYCF